MTQRSAPLAFPQAFQDDDDDVAWALSTAEVQWKRGAHPDALVWLQRAVDAALQSGRRIRAFQLQQQARALQIALDAGWLPVTSGSEPPPPVSYEDGAEPIPAGTFGRAASDVDVDVAPSRSQEPPPSVEPLDFTDDTELIEEIEDFDDLALAPGAGDTLEPAEELGEIDHPTLPPLSAVPVIEEPAAEETTEPDLGPDPRLASPRASLDVPREPASAERSALRLRYDARAERSSEPSPDSHTLSGFVRALESEAEQDTQRQQLEAEVHRELGELRERRSLDSEPVSERTSRGFFPPSDPYLQSDARVSRAVHEPLPSSGPPTAPGGFHAPGASAPPPVPELRAVSAPTTESPPVQPATEPRRAEAPAEVGGISLATVPGLENLPDESQSELAARAELHVLKPDEEVADFGLALVLEGNVAVMPSIADVAAARAGPGELVFSQGHLSEGVALRVVAGPGGARVASWPTLEFESAIADCPWVGDELKFVGDRFQALAGVCMGPMGESLDDMLRNLVLERCTIQHLLPGEVVAERGKPVRGMFVVGAGRIEIVEGDGEAAQVKKRLNPGDFIFPEGLLQATPAPARARAGEDGALVLFADRMLAHELMVSVPPLLEIFAQ